MGWYVDAAVLGDSNGFISFLVRSVYYEARLLAPNIDAVHLMTFDQKTPERNPKEADYPAPIYESYGRIVQDNVDFPVR